jgi:hypothetical protein
MAYYSPWPREERQHYKGRQQWQVQEQEPTCYWLHATVCLLPWSAVLLTPPGDSRLYSSTCPSSASCQVIGVLAMLAHLNQPHQGRNVVCQCGLLLLEPFISSRQAGSTYVENL